jgi:hypothetical protein
MYLYLQLVENEYFILFIMFTVFTILLYHLFLLLFEFCIGISYSDLLVFINRILGITVKIFTQRNR